MVRIPNHLQFHSHGLASTPDWGTDIPQALRPKRKEKKNHTHTHTHTHTHHFSGLRQDEFGPSCQTRKQGNHKLSNTAKVISGGHRSQSERLTGQRWESLSLNKSINCNGWKYTHMFKSRGS